MVTHVQDGALFHDGHDATGKTHAVFLLGKRHATMSISSTSFRVAWTWSFVGTTLQHV